VIAGPKRNAGSTACNRRWRLVPSIRSEGRRRRFVCEHSLDGGVTTSLALDAHGKSLSFALPEMEV
jgi:hypothetical protein